MNGTFALPSKLVAGLLLRLLLLGGQLLRLPGLPLWLERLLLRLLLVVERLDSLFNLLGAARADEADEALAGLLILLSVARFAIIDCGKARER